MEKDAAIKRLAGACARAWPTETLDAKLARLAEQIARWEDLPAIAEKEGLLPLVHHHLTRAEVRLPTPVRDALAAGAAHHRRAGEARLRALESVLPAFTEDKIRFLLLNGAALAYTVYPDPALRPMGDIDILIARDDAPRAVKLMFALGWHVPSDTTQPAGEPPRRLPLFERNDGDVTVAIDLNTRLSLDPADANRMYLEHFWSAAQTIAIGNATAHLPSREDLLWMAFRYGFKTSLVRDNYPLIKAADITTIVESSAEQIDWTLMSKRQPRLLSSLAWMHELTPWSFDVERRFTHVARLCSVDGIAESYAGWPRPVDTRPTKLLERVRSTLEPPSWWLRLRHGASPRRWGAVTAWCRHLLELARLRLSFAFGKSNLRRPRLPPPTDGERRRTFKRFSLRPRGF